jgi:hypothetical protein
MVQVAIDVIPQGTFYSGLTEDQVRALILVEEIGEALIEDNPEISNLYRAGEEFHTYMQIAQNYVADADAFPQVASRAVAYAIRHLIPEAELAKIRKERRTQQLEDMFGGFDSDEFREHCRRASQIRHEMGIPVDTEAMIRARGLTPWSYEEKQYALKLSEDPDYQHQTGSHKGRPHYQSITEALNNEFHHGDEIRYPNSVASFIRDTRRN